MKKTQEMYMYSVSMIDMGKSTKKCELVNDNAFFVLSLILKNDK